MKTVARKLDLNLLEGWYKRHNFNPYLEKARFKCDYEQEEGWEIGDYDYITGGSGFLQLVFRNQVVKNPMIQLNFHLELTRGILFLVPAESKLVIGLGITTKLISGYDIDFNKYVAPRSIFDKLLGRSTGSTKLNFKFPFTFYTHRRTDYSGNSAFIPSKNWTIEKIQVNGDMYEPSGRSSMMMMSMSRYRL